MVAVGPGARDESGKLVPLDLKVGDRILFGKWSGTEIKLDGEDLLIMKESDVMGVIEDQARARAARPPDSGPFPNRISSLQGVRKHVRQRSEIFAGSAREDDSRASTCSPTRCA